ncbi:mitogen-activated protein kinase kinase kinase 18 [Vigna radiata var. radiata]|uniref:Mitogen-activated protein kinase kinase kinase 18 n=1 Tax=Vigna radiata var. radiata TaxID=3916 RepID=A0A1S3UCF0_VIGRR|nr:mitogen-activated protein kinase kinase kinase 18 [Vigna radiata var. radiata]
MTSWVRGRCVGKGAFGVVNAAVSRPHGRLFAVKSVDCGLGHPCRLQALENEIRILKRVASPHVVAYLGDDVTFEHGGTVSFRNLHLEYMPGGTVADLDPADVDESLVRRYAWCLVSALRDVHARGFVHCDVKGRNVLLSGNRAAAKLADFGSAVEVEVPQDLLPRGSPMWMAPEVVRRERQGPESDVWSLGCTVIEIVNGKPPWEDHGVDTLSRIGYSDELPEFPSKLSELGKDFLEKCLRREWRERWSCDQLLQHPFLLPYAVVESSPRCVLDWVDSEFAESEHNDLEEGGWLEFNRTENSVKSRISKLATEWRVNWETEGWEAVREVELNEESWSSRTLSETEEGVNWEFSNAVGVGSCGECWHCEGVNQEIKEFGGGWERGILRIYSCKSLIRCYLLLLIYLNRLWFWIIYGVCMCLLEKCVMQLGGMYEKLMIRFGGVNCEEGNDGYSWTHDGNDIGDLN